MGLFDWIFGQFIDVIEWTDNSQDTMVYRFPRKDNEIKYGAKLTVRESQMAIFVNEGVIADVLSPGIYELDTNNLPIITSIQHWDHGFNSPFKAEIYFLNTKRFTNLKWGTKNPIMLRDPEFRMVRLRAFGTYEIKIIEPERFMKEIVGTDSLFSVDEIEHQLTNHILSKLPTILAKSKVSILDFAANYGEFGNYITEKIAPSFAEYGLGLTHILVENISLPEEVEKALDKRTSREITGDLNKHIKYQTGEALGHSAKGNSSSIGDMLGMGAGVALGQDMISQISKADKNTPPALPSRDESLYHVAIDGISDGPYDIRKIRTLIKSGELKEETLVWTKRLKDWTSAKSVFEQYFDKNTPPPLPTS
jgi:membrane protease subunit (stomatin/prohibitin family)